MADRAKSNQLNLFEESIRSRLSQMQSEKRCSWCLNPRYRIKANSLCASCYRWNLQLDKLSAEYKRLPAGTSRDASFPLRHSLDVAGCAARLCSMDGALIESALNPMSAIDLEHRFAQLARRMLGKKTASRLFNGRAAFLHDFLPFQRAWIGYLLTTMLHELNRRDRKGAASRLNLLDKSKDAEQKLTASLP